MVKRQKIESLTEKFTKWIGTPVSVLLHTLFFAVMFSLPFFGVSFEQTLLILTTVVSLEAIYLALFIQMTVNRNTASLEAVEEDIDEIQEDVEDLEEDIDEIQQDQDEDEKRDLEDQKDLDNIESQLQKVLKEIETLRQLKNVHDSH